MDPAELGGKGSSFARLATAGFPVPPGFVITAQGYRMFHDAAGLDTYVSALRQSECMPPLSVVRERC